MSGDRIARALARIESASSRIEKAAPFAAAGNAPNTQKYEALRAETTQALAEIDALIAEHSR